MTMSAARKICEKLESAGQDVHFLHVTQDRKVMICRTSNTAYSDDVCPLPVLLVHLCVIGGGRLRHSSNLQQIEGRIVPGAIGVVAPGSKGKGHWPEMTAITFAVSADVVVDSFGKSWAEKLKSKMTSQIFRDPLVEAVMMDVGYHRAGDISDDGLLHAAHLVIRQLLDRPSNQEKVSEFPVIPLGSKAINRLTEVLDANMDRNVSVAEMARLAGVSRSHFSRRFKAATGQSPHQFAIKRKLDHAATLLEQEQSIDVMGVAQQVGFSNASHFARSFRRQFGLSPRYWKFLPMRSKNILKDG
jgi:AraC-like DNA-binding protein